MKQVKLRNDMPDDMLRDAIETSRRVIGGVDDFDAHGEYIALMQRFFFWLMRGTQVYSVLKLLRMSLTVDGPPTGM